MRRHLTRRSVFLFLLLPAGAGLVLAAVVALVSDQPSGNGVLGPYNPYRLLAIAALLLMLTAQWWMRPGRMYMPVIAVLFVTGLGALFMEALTT
jgi:hypothetical protein